MKRFALLAFAFTGLAACDNVTSPPPASLSRVAAGSASVKIHENLTFDISGVTFNPCYPEPVAYQGRIHFVIKDEFDANGEQVKVISNLENFSGLGLVTGDKYRIQQNFKDEFAVTFSPTFTLDETFDIRFRVNHTGSNENLWLRQTVHVTFPPFNVEVIRNELECRG